MSAPQTKKPGKWLPATLRGRMILVIFLVVVAAGWIITLQYESEIKNAWRRWRNRMPESVWRRLRDAKEVTVYSLYPDNGSGGCPKFEVIPELKNKRLSELPLFNGYPVLGEFSSKDTGLFEMVANGLRDGTHYPKRSSFMCFFPRHGLRVTDADGTFDLVICMECRRFSVYEDGEVESHHTFNTEMGGAFPPKERLNTVLKEHGLPTASTEPLRETAD